MRATFRGREQKRNGKEKLLRRQSPKGRKRGIRLLQRHQELKLMITLQIMKSRLDRIRLFKRFQFKPHFAIFPLDHPTSALRALLRSSLFTRSLSFAAASRSGGSCAFEAARFLDTSSEYCPLSCARMSAGSF